jgi:hypothetical protein
MSVTVVVAGDDESCDDQLCDYAYCELSKLRRISDPGPAHDLMDPSSINPVVDAIGENIFGQSAIRKPAHPAM